MLQFEKSFGEECKTVFESDSKIGLLCSVAPDGYPHIALISSISVKDSRTMMWGHFSRGLSKDYLKENQKTAFLVVLADMRWWTGKVLHTGSAAKGEDYEYFNNKPLFRYNSYFGFNAVHYCELVEISTVEKLSIAKIALGFMASGALIKKARKKSGSVSQQGKIPAFGMNLASSPACLKFAAFVDSDGFPRIFPVMQGQPADSQTLVFSKMPYGELLRQIPDGAKTAVYLANFNLESMLLQGRWSGIGNTGKPEGCKFEVDKVYNSMLPLSGYIYPPKTLPNVFGIKEA